MIGVEWLICTKLFYQLSRAGNSQGWAMGWGSNEIKVSYTKRSLERTENLSKTFFRVT